jgi:hypothetical protein
VVGVSFRHSLQQRGSRKHSPPCDVVVFQLQLEAPIVAVVSALEPEPDAFRSAMGGDFPAMKSGQASRRSHLPSAGLSADYDGAGLTNTERLQAVEPDLRR